MNCGIQPEVLPLSKPGKSQAKEKKGGGVNYLENGCCEI